MPEGAHVWRATPPESERAVEAWKRLQAIWADQGVKNTRKLYVVYYTTADREPYPDHRARLNQVVKDVSDYYAREMVANGLPPITFDYERDTGGVLKIHFVKGDLPLEKFDKHGNAGRVTSEAANKVLREAGVDPDTNHILIVCQMPDGISPYYGSGGFRSGRCWICDLPDFKPENLHSTLSKEDTFKLAKNAEELAQFRGRALGDHTTVYMGGTAHELGHCFNLPHTGDSPEQYAAWGKSLMGSGNYAYGGEYRGAGKGAFLNPTDALRLIGQPLFSGVDYRLGDRGEAKFADLVAKPEGNGVRVSGRIASAKVPVYAALVTFLFDQPGGDYPSNAVSSLVDPKTGEFSAVIAREHNGPVDIMITALHANGDRSDLHTRTLSRGHVLDISRLNLEWVFASVASLSAKGDAAGARAALDDVLRKHAGDATIAVRAEAWRAAFRDPVTPTTAPAAVPAATTSVALADCAAVSEKTGYGPMKPSRGFIPGNDSGIGALPLVGHRVPKTSLFTHAPGAFVFDLGGTWKKLTGYYGVQVGASGTVGLTIIGDGKVLFDGPEVSLGRNYNSRSADKTRPGDFAVDVTGVKTLELRVTAPKGRGSAWGVIGDPTLAR